MRETTLSAELAIVANNAPLGVIVTCALASLGGCVDECTCAEGSRREALRDRCSSGRPDDLIQYMKSDLDEREFSSLHVLELENFSL